MYRKNLMESSTIERNDSTLDDMLSDGDNENENNRLGKGTIAVLIAVTVFVIAGIVAVVSFIGNFQADQQEKHERMEAIAATFSEGQNWEQVKSESPSENSQGWVVKEWKVNAQSEVATATEKLGITMVDVAYPAGCKEGSNGEFLIQVCSSPDTRKLQMVVGE